MKPNYLHIWPRNTFMMIALPNMVRVNYLYFTFFLHSALCHCSTIKLALIKPSKTFVCDFIACVWQILAGGGAKPVHQ